MYRRADVSMPKSRIGLKFTDRPPASCHDPIRRSASSGVAVIDNRRCDFTMCQAFADLERLQNRGESLKMRGPLMATWRGFGTAQADGLSRRE